MVRQFLFLFFILCFSRQLSSQNLSGIVKDSAGIPLERTNVIARPMQQGGTMKYYITQADGKYYLDLDQSIPYEVSASYIGYERAVITYTPTTKNDIHDFVLSSSNESLETVTIKYEPIEFKKDTIVYNVAAFNTGSERKLRDVLKNLPGVEVDRDGKVTVNGNPVSRVLVENKVFFTGNSRLAVNNIPADAVNKVEVLENYSDIALLKGLEDSEETVLNIVLKEDKKQFVFGDIEAGGGIEERYLIYPKLFYYSPKTSVNFIADINNLSEKSFTLQDYIEFEGGFAKLMSNSGAFQNIYNSDIARFLSQNDYHSNVSQFGAIHLRQSVTDETDLSGYVIVSNNETVSEQHTLNIYTSDNPFEENRTQVNTLNNFFAIGKLSLRHLPNRDEDLSLDSYFKYIHNNALGETQTVTPFSDLFITAQNFSENYQFKQDLNYTRKLSKAHTITTNLTYNIQKDRPENDWLTNQPILQTFIPLEDDDAYHIFQNKKVLSHQFQGVFKDYWILHRFHHLYSSVGVNATFSGFFTEEWQSLSNGAVNPFNASGFGNDFSYAMVNPYLGLEYKFQVGNMVFKPAVFLQFYNWNIRQTTKNSSRNTVSLLPKLDIDLESKTGNKWSFRYAKNQRFASIEQLANHFVLTSFSSVFKGNPYLENEEYHTFRLRWYKFNMFRGFSYNVSTSYNRKVKNLKNTTELSGIEQYATVILYDRPENMWNTTAMAQRTIKRIRFSLSASYVYSDFYQLLNQSEQLNISKNLTGTIGVTTLFKNLPNITVNYSKRINEYRTQNSRPVFESDFFSAGLDYVFLKDFTLKADYLFSKYLNRNIDIENTYNNLNVSLFYQKENSPWGFEINATNLLNNAIRQQNSFSDFIISDQKIFLFPRVMLFKVVYKL